MKLGLKYSNGTAYLSTMPVDGLDFGKHLWLIEALFSTVRNDQTGKFRMLIESGEATIFADGFAYFPIGGDSDESNERYFGKFKPFFNGFANDDLWVIGTNFGEEEDRFLVFPRTCLLGLLEEADFHDLNNRFLGDGKI